MKVAVGADGSDGRWEVVVESAELDVLNDVAEVDKGGGDGVDRLVLAVLEPLV